MAMFRLRFKKGGDFEKKSRYYHFIFWDIVISELANTGQLNCIAEIWVNNKTWE